MKRSSFKLYILFIGVILASCSKDFLDRKPLDKISSADYWTNTNDLKLYVNQFYTKFPSHGTGYGGGMFWRDNNSDNLVPRSFNARMNGSWNKPTSGGGWGWTDIRNVNYFLDNYDNVPGDSKDKKSYVGEARFFRAYFYFSLVKQFGDVPWYDHVLQPGAEELYKARDSRNFVIDKILEDLDYAIENLKGSGAQTSMRVTKEVALLFKSRVALFEGTWEKYHEGTDFGVKDANPTKYLDLAATAAKALIDLGTCQIYSDGNTETSYYTLFNKTDYKGVTEVMLWRQYDQDLTLRHNLQRYLQPGAGTALSKDFCDSYLDKEGRPLAVSTFENSYVSLSGMSKDRDPRMRQTLYIPGRVKINNKPNGAADELYERPPIDVAGEDGNMTGLVSCKGMDPDYLQSYSSFQSTTGAIVFRYAEALLNYAEAKAELGTITQADLDISINKLRDRVGMVHLELGAIVADPNWKFPTLSPIINEVRRERRIEFVTTGFRFDDLMRWKAANLFVGKRPRGMMYVGGEFEGKYLDDKGTDLITLGKNINVDENGFIDPYKKALPAGYGFKEDRDYLKPIPTNELTINKNLQQNPGWDK
ncbi:RagB/SusD family nutrient uptake outer membrane protein [Halosquirtibacter xylanolyticus]|uniref:RagB/SusD family nutrient uptake outer membrane protein n=1 Tax=Halosquirtibacter xylanolyticus TaxID=3374599 RepID=UPI00374A1773|nr:RagB/SusD family nutrient uptake outer membrane protein [Prolixibacteraceae bacterium]